MNTPLNWTEQWTVTPEHLRPFVPPLRRQRSALATIPVWSHVAPIVPAPLSTSESKQHKRAAYDRARYQRLKKERAA
jgi:hypothetical protein